MRLQLVTVVFLLISNLLVGCAHSIHQVQVSEFQPGVAIESGEVVKAQTEQFVVLGFVGNTDYVDQAFAKLQQSCAKGEVTAITTQFSTSLGFFSWTNKILMQGVCTVR